MASRDLGERLAPLRVPAIRRILATTLIGFVAVYIFYAYVSVIYAPLTNDTTFLALILVVIGVAGTVGNLIAGHLTDRLGARAVVTTVLLITAAGVLTAGFATSRPTALITAAVYGLAAWAISGPQQHRLLAADAGHTGLPVALNSSAMYLAIAIAAALGGMLTTTGSWGLVTAAAIAAVAAAAISLRADRKPGLEQDRE